MNSGTRRSKWLCDNWVEARLKGTGEFRDSSQHRTQLIELISSELSARFELSASDLKTALEEIVPEFKFFRGFTMAEVEVAKALDLYAQGKKPFPTKRGAKVNQGDAFALVYAVARTNNLYATELLFNKGSAVIKRSIANLGKSMGITHHAVKITRQASPIDCTMVEDWQLQQITNERDFYLETVRAIKRSKSLSEQAEREFLKFIQIHFPELNPELWVEQNIRVQN